MTIDPELLSAYRSTRYHVRHGGGFDILVGLRCEELVALHASEGVSSSAFITAWNPQSRVLDREENDARNALLRRDIEALGLRCFEGEGVGSNGWREESFLVPGATLEQAVALARAYQQNAIVFAGEDGLPRLEVTA